MLAMASDLLFLEEVAEMTRVPVSCVRFWIRTGKLSSLKPGRRVLVRRATLDKFLSDSERCGTSRGVDGGRASQLDLWMPEST
jgi:excisionase family DNA binding protein